MSTKMTKTMVCDICGNSEQFSVDEKIVGWGSLTLFGDPNRRLDLCPRTIALAGLPDA